MNSYHVLCPQDIKSKLSQLVSWLAFQMHGMTFTFAARWYLNYVLKAAECFTDTTVAAEMMKYGLFWCSVLQRKKSCAGRMLISLSSKCWIPLNINHWTAELINQTEAHTCQRLCVFSYFYCFSRKVTISRFIVLIEMCAHRAYLWSFPAGWQVMSRCPSCHWTLYQRRTWAGPTTSFVTGSNWKRSSAGCADETRAWRRLWERPSPWAP